MRNIRIKIRAFIEGVVRLPLFHLLLGDLGFLIMPFIIAFTESGLPRPMRWLACASGLYFNALRLIVEKIELRDRGSLLGVRGRVIKTVYLSYKYEYRSALKILPEQSGGAISLVASSEGGLSIDNRHGALTVMIEKE